MYTQKYIFKKVKNEKYSPNNADSPKWSLLVISKIETGKRMVKRYIFFLLLKCKKHSKPSSISSVSFFLGMKKALGVLA